MRQDRDSVAPALERLKIFPLPTAVLLPGAVLPLHIFEPRYRKMVADALATDRVLAMSMLDAGWEADYHGRPRVRPVVGVGRILQEEKLADGRYNIQLVGVTRAVIESELEPSEPYRQVQARLADEVLPADPTAGESLRAALVSLCGMLPDESGQALAKASAALRDPGDLADICVAALSSEAGTRQRALEELDVVARLEVALEVVGEALLNLKPESPGGLN